MASPDTGRSAFFYGTLMAPQVLHRVCHGSTSPSNPVYTTHQWVTTPAILHNHRRHRVKEADYPAIVPHPTSTVRGTHVSGLTAVDIWRLDIYEASEYSREKVTVRLLNPSTNEETGEEVEAEAYIWKAPTSDLEDAEWDFDQFKREKMRFWVGRQGEGEYAGRASFLEVDEAVAAADKENDGTRGRGGNGHIATALDKEIQKDAV